MLRFQREDRYQNVKRSLVDVAEKLKAENEKPPDSVEELRRGIALGDRIGPEIAAIQTLIAEIQEQGLTDGRLLRLEAWTNSVTEQIEGKEHSIC